MARNKYRFKTRIEAETQVAHCESQLTLHRIALDCILRDEFTMTARFTAPNGAWFEMGIARADKAHGGLVLCREFYPTNLKPSQSAKWADSWIREMAEYFAAYLPDSQEDTYAYRECFHALRALYHTATQAA